MDEEVKLYQLKAGFATHNNLLIYFSAKVLAETERAVYLYGHGTGETVRLGVCCKCGRTLTHPVSVELGIGPECGGHYWNWDYIGGYTPENIERLRGALVDIVIDSWVPKSQIVNRLETNDIVEVPTNHPMLSFKLNKNTKMIAALAENQRGEPVMRLKFPFSYETLDVIKALPGRTFHKEEKVWSVPITEKAVQDLVRWGFELDDKLVKFLESKKTRTQTISEIKVIPGLSGELFPFQKIGVAFIENQLGRALIADEMGLGKTIQALAWLQLHPEKRPAIIVVPASLKLNWKKEAIRWMTNPKVEVLSGTQPWSTTGDLLIINYDILWDWVTELKQRNPVVLITDECHYYKSNQAKRTKAIKSIGKGIDHVIALSGTPIVNRPIEAYNALRLIDPNLFPDPWKFARQYCNLRNNGFGWDFSGASNTQELHEVLTKTVMIRRLKSDVMKDLPAKIHSFVPIELDNQTEYDEAENGFIEYIRKMKGQDAAMRASNAEALASIEVLKQVAVRGKLNEAMDWIENFIEVDGKLVVFAVHKFVIDALMERFSKIAVKIDGSVSNNDRQSAVDAFQSNDGVRLFVGNIRAAGLGITLTASSNVVFLELPWTPGELVQAEDRCHRIGQKDSVTIHYLLATGTIEERIASLIDKKRQVLDSVLDGIETESESLLAQLMKSYE
jgi:SWI/SNF-related matrix-associated actin-dependent regulator of chromatin subfamily A-like protein 1